FVSAGVFGNLIIFLTARVTGLKRMELAYSVFVSVGLLFWLSLKVIGQLAGMPDTGVSLAVAYAVACSLWCVIHRLAARR
ncbi:MAG TPA: hypothetical protein VF508_01775, partial [Pyrinomonadaceae bacterium]